MRVRALAQVFYEWSDGAYDAAFPSERGLSRCSMRARAARTRTFARTRAHARTRVVLMHG
jgi:hypothetical protein